MSENKKLISIIIPCYRSENTIGKVMEEIDAVFQNNEEYDYEAVLVNDCPPDNTLGEIKEICADNKKVKGIDLSRNFGQASAKLAGLPYAEGDIIVYMDDDGQHPATGIIELAKKIEEGYDIVYAKFPKKKASFFKKITSRLHQKINEAMGTKPKGISISSFTAWSRFAADAVKAYKSPFPSAGTYLYKITSRVANVEIDHRARMSGRSGYNLKKLLSLWMTSVTNFSIAPLRIAAAMGFCIAGVGFLSGLIIAIRKIINPAISAGYTSMITVMLILGGIIMVILGIIGEYIGRIYMTLCDMPQYSIRDEINTDKETEE